jgi:hypothetical protein
VDQNSHFSNSEKKGTSGLTVSAMVGTMEELCARQVDARALASARHPPQDVPTTATKENPLVGASALLQRQRISPVRR